MSLTALKYFGGGEYRETAVDVTLPHGLARAWVIKPTVGGCSVVLPDATKLAAGVTYLILNEGSYYLGVKDADGGVVLPALGVGSIYNGMCGHASLVDNSTAAGVWRVRLSSIGVGTATLPYRKLWVVGGNTTGTTPDGTVAYYYDGSVWAVGGSPAQAHIEAAFLGLGTPYGGRALLAGHRNAGGTLFAYADELDEAGTWTTVTNVPYSVGRCAGSGVGGKGYLCGGEGLSYLAEYARPSWAQKNVLPAPIDRGGAVRIADKIMIVPGEPYGLLTPKVYWPAADAYYDATAPSANRREFAAWGAHDYLYLAGGYQPGAGTPQIASAERYSPTADTWTGLTAMSLGARYAAAGAGGNGGGYVAGGRDTSNLERTEAAHYVEDTWFALGTSMPGAKAECAGTVL